MRPHPEDSEPEARRTTLEVNQLDAWHGIQAAQRYGEFAIEGEVTVDTPDTAVPPNPVSHIRYNVCSPWNAGEVAR